MELALRSMNFWALPQWKSRWCALLEKTRRVESPADSEQLLAHLAAPEVPFVLAFVNAHAMNSAANSVLFFDALSAADMLLRDGSGMATLFRWTKLEPGLNMNGTDLIPQLISRFDGRKIALFGTRNPFLTDGSNSVSKSLAPASSQVTAHGFLDVDQYVELALAHRPALIVLGMGMPRQEQVAAVLRSKLDFACLIVCGGAVIDFLAGRTPRAPIWMRKTGLEWVFRLAMEPRRLFQRYVIGNPLFLLRAFRLASSPGKL